jgi:hypothetical protein
MREASKAADGAALQDAGALIQAPCHNGHREQGYCSSRNRTGNPPIPFYINGSVYVYMTVRA